MGNCWEYGACLSILCLNFINLLQSPKTLSVYVFPLFHAWHSASVTFIPVSKNYNRIHVSYIVFVNENIQNNSLLEYILTDLAFQIECQ